MENPEDSQAEGSHERIEEIRGEALVDASQNVSHLNAQRPGQHMQGFQR
jgi:hypothetical protein